uniref:hypothetical protein n=1 Tax=Jatropha curcas TaxID=180498 RepID=UPI0027A2C279|nr:hypothetical protein QLP06_mgp057 [Jatropha curcas]WFG81182.1 hypothetical protein [Jatropha curcas]
MAKNWLAAKLLPQKHFCECFLYLANFDRKREVHMWNPFHDRFFGADWFKKLVLSKSCSRREKKDIWKAILVARDLPVFLSKDIYLEQYSPNQCAGQFNLATCNPFLFPSIKPSTSHGTLDHLRGWTNRAREVYYNDLQSTKKVVHHIRWKPACLGGIIIRVTFPPPANYSRSRWAYPDRGFDSYLSLTY